MKIKTAFASLLTLAMLSCAAPVPAGAETAPGEETPVFEYIGGSSGGFIDIYVFTDRNTGCQYLVSQGYKSGGLLPE